MSVSAVSSMQAQLTQVQQENLQLKGEIELLRAALANVQINQPQNQRKRGRPVWEQVSLSHLDCVMWSSFYVN